MVDPGIPKDLGEESLRRLARSFYVVKMLRYAALLVAALVFVALCVARGDTPVAVTATLAVLSLALAVAMLATHRRYLSSQQPPSTGPASRSPRG